MTSTDEMAWVWKEELLFHRSVMNNAAQDLKLLIRCLSGQKVMDAKSEEILGMMTNGFVPSSWFEINPTDRMCTIHFLVDSIKKKKQVLEVRMFQSFC